MKTVWQSFTFVASVWHQSSRTCSTDLESLQLIFTARHYASSLYAVVMCVCLSVRPSVCLSQVGSSTKMTKPRITQTMLYYSPGSLVFWCRKSRKNSNDITPNGGAKWRWGRFISAIFDQYLATSQKWCKRGTQLLWKANRNSQAYALYRTALFAMTLGDPNYPKSPHFRHFVSPFISS